MMGMSESEFYDTTPRYFSNRQKGWRHSINREENWHKWHLNLHRSFYSALYNIQLEKSSRQSAFDYFPFPWDEKPKKETVEDVRQWVKDHGYAEIPIDQF